MGLTDKPSPDAAADDAEVSEDPQAEPVSYTHLTLPTSDLV